MPLASSGQYFLDRYVIKLLHEGREVNLPQKVPLQASFWHYIKCQNDALLLCFKWDSLMRK
jgi:hypothetical protein